LEGDGTRRKRQPSPEQAVGLNSALDLSPYLPDILEAQRAAWGLEIPPQPPQGDDRERLLQAYHLGEHHKPGAGVAWACLAVKGHRAKVASEGLEGLAAERRMAWPPVQETGPDGRPRAKWRELDAARYSELVEEGRWVGRRRPETWADGRPRAPGQ
jgi:hypothetical protein